MIDHNDIKTGNSDLVKALFKASKSKVLLNTTVTKVSKLANGKYSVETGDSVLIYDIVLIAAPLELTGIEFFNTTVPSKIVDRKYYPWNVCIVEADSINTDQFKPYANITTVP